MSVDDPLEQRRLLLNYDHYQRYKITADFVHNVRTAGETFSVLEVGSGGLQELALFLPEDRICFLDRSFPPHLSGKPGFVAGDATALPFNDGTFDVVVSIDVYEHIVSGKRPLYLKELWRTSRRLIILAAPFDTELVALYERLCNEYYRAIHRAGHPWLQEHLANGLPDLSRTVDFFTGKSCLVETVPNGYLPRWLIMQIPYFLVLKNDLLKGLFTQLNAFYNQCCYAGDNREPAYRRVLVICKKPADLKRVLQLKKQLLAAGSGGDSGRVAEETLDYLLASFWYLDGISQGKIN